MTKEGHSFEKSAILTWLSNHSTSPLTREPLLMTQLVSNHALKTEIQAWRESRMYDSNSEGSATTDSETEQTSDDDDDDFEEDDNVDKSNDDIYQSSDTTQESRIFLCRLSDEEIKQLGLPQLELGDSTNSSGNDDDDGDVDAVEVSTGTPSRQLLTQDLNANSEQPQEEQLRAVRTSNLFGLQRRRQQQQQRTNASRQN